MAEAIIVRWNPDRGFGFVRFEDSREAFLHVSSIEPRQPRGVDLRGRKIEVHEIFETEKGLKVTSVAFTSDLIDLSEEKRTTLVQLDELLELMNILEMEVAKKGEVRGMYLYYPHPREAKELAKRMLSLIDDIDEVVEKAYSKLPKVPRALRVRRSGPYAKAKYVFAMLGKTCSGLNKARVYLQALLGETSEYVPCAELDSAKRYAGRILERFPRFEEESVKQYIFDEDGWNLTK